MVFLIVDRVYVIEIGKIVLFGDVKEIAVNFEVKKVYLGG